MTNAQLPRVITLDFETYYDKDYSLSKMPTEAYIRDPRFQIICVVVRDVEGGMHVIDGADGMQNMHDRLCELGADIHPMLCQNTRFDGAIAAWHLNIKPPLYLDTMGMAAALLRSETGSTSLKSMAEHFNFPPKGTAVHDMIGRRREDLTPKQFVDYADYCKHDVALTFLSFCMMRKDFPSMQMLAVDTVLRMFIQPTIEVDIPMCHAAIEEDAALLQMKLRAANVDIDTVMSNPKFAERLSQHVTVPMKTSVRTGKSTTAFAKADAEFAKLVRHPNPTVRALIDARLAAKSTISRTRFEAFASTAERNFGKLPIPLRYRGAITGRLAGDDKINLQNLTRGSLLRRALRAPKDHFILAADQGQIEARLNAVFSEQDDLVEDFRNKVDIYSNFAATLYGYAVHKDTHPVERFVGKTCILGLGYYMGADRLLDTLITKLAVDRDFAQLCVDTYRRRYSKIVANWKRAQGMLAHMAVPDAGVRTWGPLRVQHEKIILPSGLFLHYPDLCFTADGNMRYRERQRAGRARVGGQGEWTDMYSGKLVENCVQAMAAEIIMEQMVAIQLAGIKTAMQVHDEIVCVVHKNKIEQAVETMRRIMTTPPKWMPQIPLAIDIKYGETYADCK